MTNMNNICLIILITVILVIFCYSFTDTFRIKTENYTPSVVRYLPCNKNQNTFPFPYTNNKLNTTSNNDVYTYQYGNRKILNPEQYLSLVKKLLNNLSLKKINVSTISDKSLIEKDFNGDQSYITNFMNNKIDELIKTKSYLQHNGPWKYEYFHTSNPTIYYYEINNKNGEYANLPRKFNLFKIIYTLANPLRSSYTSCLAFITQINNELEIQYTSLVNDFDRTVKDNLQVIPNEALKFSLINTVIENDFDQFAIPTDYSGLNYIEEPKFGTKVEVKADIPKEFKADNFHPQHLPPSFGDGNVKYPPLYKTQNDKSEYFSSSSICSGKEYDSSTKKCTECGPIAFTKKCTECGIIDPSKQACTKCGLIDPNIQACTKCGLINNIQKQGCCENSDPPNKKYLNTKQKCTKCGLIDVTSRCVSCHGESGFNLIKNANPRNTPCVIVNSKGQQQGTQNNVIISESGQFGCDPKSDERVYDWQCCPAGFTYQQDKTCLNTSTQQKCTWPCNDIIF